MMNNPRYRRFGRWMISVVLVSGLYGCQSQQPAIDQLTREKAELQQQNADLNKELADATAAVQKAKADAMDTVDDLVKLFDAAKQASGLNKQLATIQKRTHDSEAAANKAQNDAATLRKENEQLKASSEAAANKAQTDATKLRWENEQLKAKLAESQVLESDLDALPEFSETR